MVLFTRSLIPEVRHSLKKSLADRRHVRDGQYKWSQKSKFDISMLSSLCPVKEKSTCGLWLAPIARVLYSAEHQVPELLVEIKCCALILRTDMKKVRFVIVTTLHISSWTPYRVGWTCMIAVVPAKTGASKVSSCKGINSTRHVCGLQD